MLSGIGDKLTKVSMYRAILKNQIWKLIAFVKRVLSREAVAEQYLENWKNYYSILQVNPNAEAEAITAAYKRLVHLYHHTLSDKTKKSPFFSEMMNDVLQAIEAKDASRLDAYAHKLKGASATVSAIGIQDIAFELEKMGKNNDLTEAKNFYDKLEQIKEKTIFEISNYLKSFNC